MRLFSSLYACMGLRAVETGKQDSPCCQRSLLHSAVSRLEHVASHKVRPELHGRLVPGRVLLHAQVRQCVRLAWCWKRGDEVCASAGLVRRAFQTMGVECSSSMRSLALRLGYLAGR